MKEYSFSFGDGDPATYGGLSPTFTYFADSTGNTYVPPGITEPIANSGIYYFSYAPTFSISFTIDGTSSIATSSDRYITNNLDPIQVVDQRIGDANSDIGNTLTVPDTVLGYLRRNFSVQEGEAVFTKASGKWQVYAKGSSTLLFEKDLTNNTTEARKS